MRRVASRHATKRLLVFVEYISILHTPQRYVAEVIYSKLSRQLAVSNCFR